MRISRYREKSAVKTARKNRLEIIAAQLSRREMMKFGLIGASGYLVSKHGLSHVASGGGLAGCDSRTLGSVAARGARETQRFADRGMSTGTASP